MSINAVKARPLVFSMGFNWYADVWQRCVASHKPYADRIGADYAFVTRAEPTPLLMESTWLKIPLILAALKAGYQWVLYLDADTRISDDAPDFRCIAENNKDIYMANGTSGRSNAGVIMVHNTERAAAVFSVILEHAGMKLPPEDVVGWGDNGEVIHFTKQYRGLKRIPRVWNNNAEPELKDYIRHFSAGPIRPLYRFTEEETAIAKQAAEWNQAHSLKRDAGVPEFHRDIAELLAEVTRDRPEFSI